MCQQRVDWMDGGEIGGNGQDVLLLLLKQLID
jgi:hypothetical protein